MAGHRFARPGRARARAKCPRCRRLPQRHRRYVRDRQEWMSAGNSRYNVHMSDVFRIRDFEIRNRLFVGTGKYASYELMQQALDASGCQVVTVAVRRERLVDQQGRSLLDFLNLDKYVILPNTAGCFSAEDAIRVALLGRDLLEKNGNRGAGWVKLEVLGDKKTLLPDPVGTIEATKELVKEGFTVLAYS